MKTKFLFAVAILSFSATSIAAEKGKVALPSNASSIAQVEVGKVTYVSKNQLTPEMKFRTEEDIKNLSKGYELIQDEVFEFRENYHERLRQPGDAAGKLNMTPADISSTVLANYTYEGFIPDGPTHDGPWTNIIRVFKRPDGVPIFLNEWDYVADGGAIVIVQEMMNTKVKKFPARIMLKKSNTGKNMTDLAWATEKKYFTLTVWDDVNTNSPNKPYNRDWFIGIAQGIK